MSEQVTQLTCEGIQKLATELIEVYESRKTPFSHSEKWAEEESGFYNQRIKVLERLLYSAEPLPTGKRKDIVTLGCNVTLFDTYLEEVETYKLVHPIEASPSLKYLSVESPLGKELLLRRKGEQVSVSVYGDPIRYTIIDLN